MFRLLAKWLKAGPAAVNPAADGDAVALFRLHPIQLFRYLDEAWAFGGFEPYPVLGVPGPPKELYLGGPGVIDDLALPDGLREGELRSGITFPGPPVDPPPRPVFAPAGNPPGLFAGVKQPWEHLIYAYLIENTRIVPIMRRVVEWYGFSSRLESPSPDTRRVLRILNDVVFTPSPPFSIASLDGSISPDMEACRRFAYWDMFGMDLNHGRDDGSPYPYPRSADANAMFVPLTETLLREAWQGFSNRLNTSGVNTTDNEAAANTSDKLAKTLRTKRLNGNQAQPEFVHTAMMSLLHLLVESDNPFIADLKATAPSPDERLRKIGARVGIAPHPKARDFFELAEPASSLLRFIELERFSDAATAGVLYDPTPGNRVREDMLVMINHWSSATGRNIKVRRLREAPPTAIRRRPAALPLTGSASLAPTTMTLNGYGRR